MYNNKTNRWEIIFYLLPALILIILFIYTPIIMNFIFSLSRWNAFSTNKVWVGFGNFKQLFQDDIFWHALRNNIFYVIISVFFQGGISLLIAAILEQKWIRSFSGIFRTVYFLPSVLSLTMVALLWQMLFNPTIGLINVFTDILGLPPSDILGSSKTSIFGVIAVSQWQWVGYTTFLYVIGIQGIPYERYEAAMIDGAGEFTRFRMITIPGCRETILLVLTTTIIGAFKVFDEVYIMTGGGPGRSSEVLGTLLYRSAFRNDRMGYASAIAVILFIITFCLSIFQIKMYDIKSAKDNR